MTPACLVGLAVRKVRIPLKTKVEHASHARVESENLIVEARLDDGTVGFGEGVPRQYVTGETIDLSMDLLRRTVWNDQVHPVASYEEAVEMVRSLALPAVEGDERGCVGNAARCALELALLDAYGRRFGKPISSLATLPEFSSIYKPISECRYSGAITSGSPRKEFFSAIKMRLFRFKDVKIKVGTAGQDDERRLALFRRWLPGRVFRVDANEAWSPENVVERIKALEPFDIKAVEQPVKHEDAACLASVRKQIATPIMLDESLCSMRDAEVAVASGICDVFNIRLSKCGGFLRSLALAAFAKRNGLKYQLGCQVGETGVLSAAGRHFACSVADLMFVEGSFDRFLVKERLTDENLTFSFGGKAQKLTGNGLGIHVNRDRLSSVTESTEWLVGGESRDA